MNGEMKTPNTETAEKGRALGSGVVDVRQFLLVSSILPILQFWPQKRLCSLLISTIYATGKSAFRY